MGPFSRMRPLAPRPVLGRSYQPLLTRLTVLMALLVGWPAAVARADDESKAQPPAAKETTTSPEAPATGADAEGDQAESPPESQGRWFRPGHRSVGLDLNLDGALGWVPEREHITGFARARVGVLVFIEPLDPTGSQLALSTGLTYEASDLSGATIGLQTELIHIGTGFWGQAGALVDLLVPSPGFMVAVGWSLFGVEVQRRLYDVNRNGASDGLNSFGLYAKVRVPISIIMRAF